MAYSPPSSAKPFTLSISDQDLNDCLQLLRLSKLGPKTYENTQTERDYGITYQWLSDAKDYWLNKYDWRATEAHINSFDNFKMEIDGLDVHFIGLFSAKKDAIPIIFMHGWPGSFVEFIPMLDLIKKQYPTKESLPYHVIVPSLTGYTLSSGGPLDRDWKMVDTATAMHKLMVNLGFEKYIAQGGDVGSFLGRSMAVMFDECVAVHLNLMTSATPIDLEKLSDLEKKSLQKARTFRESGSAYQQIHATKPATIGHAVQSNPLSLLAWIGEKFIAWSDETPSLDHIITNIALYWFTGGFPRSIYPYRNLFSTDGKRPEVLAIKIEKPTGVSYFPAELFPAIKHVIEPHCNLVHYTQHQKGGHFAALECPKELWGDVEEFVGKAWKGTDGAKL